MADLAADPGLRLRVDEIGEPPPGRLVFRRIEAGAAGRDPSFGADAGHLDRDQASAPLRPLGVMREVPVRRPAVDRLVLGHRGDGHAVRERHVPELEGREHRRATGIGARLLLEPGLRRFQPPAVAQAQVLMTNALAARQQRIVELHGVEMEIALKLLEPLRRVARRRLEPQHFQPPLLLVAREGLRQVRLRVHQLRQQDRALQGQLGAGADGKVGGGGGVAQQRQVPVAPAPAEHPVEVEPGRAAQMTRIRDQPVAAEIFPEDRLADPDALLLRHPVEAPGGPGLLGAFDDEGRGVLVELVGVRPHPAFGCVLEQEGEGVVELLARAEPDELAGAHVDLGPEDAGEGGARLRVDPVRRHDEIVFRHERRNVVDFRLEPELDPERPRALLQQHEEPPAPDAAEPVAAGDRRHAPVVNGDIVPPGEVRADRLGAFRVVSCEIVERLVGEDHAPAERVVGAVALEDGDLVRGVAQLRAYREIQSRRTAAEACRLHASLPCRYAGQECAARDFISSINYIKLK